jgi:hypothetical protein
MTIHVPTIRGNMSEQLENAIRITQGRIDDLEGELKRERDFMARLIPGQIRQPGRRINNRTKWVDVFAAIDAKPMKHEHIIDFIEENALTMSRGATRVWLNDKVKREHLNRDKTGLYTVTPSGRDWLKAFSLQTSSPD